MQVRVEFTTEPFHGEDDQLPAHVTAAADVLRYAGLSPDHLSRVFLAATGRRPMDYFQRRRAQHATVRILDRARSITDVAYELGYADAAHLSRAFRHFYGVSPRAYRKTFERPSPSPRTTSRSDRMPAI